MQWLERPDNKAKIIHKSIEMVLYFPIPILKIGKKINEFICLFTKEASNWKALYKEYKS